MIDLSLMKRIDVDPDRRLARVAAGVTWGEFNRVAGRFGLATTGGTVDSTGVAGLTLGGGLGYLMGAFGLACDNLHAADVVTASGEVVRASVADDAELLWALRGGGGNFGVAASLDLGLHTVRTVLSGVVAHRYEDAATALAYYGEFSETAPDDLGLAVALTHAPHGRKVAVTAMCHAGADPRQAHSDVAKLRGSGRPLVDTVRETPYPIVNRILDGAFPSGARNYWKSSFLSELSVAAIAVVVEAFESVPSPMTFVVIECVHGAATRVAPSATAFPHRRPGHSILILSQWRDRRVDQVNIDWTRDLFARLAPFRDGRRYGNYLSADDAGAAREAYGANYDGLVAVKRRLDPENLFHLNTNIDPGR